MKSDFGEYYGSRASLIVYGFPRFTLQQATISQIWVIGGAEGDETKINTVQAGWQVSKINILQTQVTKRHLLHHRTSFLRTLKSTT